MSRATGGGGQARPRLPRAIQVRIADVPRHLDALRYATETFRPAFTAESFAAAARSADPADITQVYAVERGFELVVNYIAELTREALEATGLRNPDAPDNAPADLRLLRDHGGIGQAQCDTLIRLCRLRNELVHDYPDVRTNAVYHGVRALLGHVEPFLRSYGAWLRRELA